ncbi:hypothetical protein BC830DRAFT_28565 [Chytriomyces sp. MP71]|nr:hypothetical protein BC830DRAFT_28565 [Chytriomyces sp. MP71]
MDRGLFRSEVEAVIGRIMQGEDINSPAVGKVIQDLMGVVMKHVPTTPQGAKPPTQLTTTSHRPDIDIIWFNTIPKTSRRDTTGQRKRLHWIGQTTLFSPMHAASRTVSENAHPMAVSNTTWCTRMASPEFLRPLPPHHATALAVGPRMRFCSCRMPRLR